jgi:hypothetical protein
LSRLTTLKNLEHILENFLSRAVETEEPLMENMKMMGSLDEIARESLKGRFINNRLGDWFGRYRAVLESPRVGEKEMTHIANLLTTIKSGLDGSIPESAKLAREIDQWHGKGMIPKRKLVFKIRPPEETENLTEKFLNLSRKELEYLGSGEFGSMHLLSVLDDVLKSAEAKEDRMYLHMAASMIYFLKSNGYKVGPFVKRLKDIENHKLQVNVD